MAHLLSCGIIESVNEIYFMVKEGGLGDGCRHDGNLEWLAVSIQTSIPVERITHCLTIEQQDLHFGR